MQRVGDPMDVDPAESKRDHDRSDSESDRDEPTMDPPDNDGGGAGGGNTTRSDI